MTKKRQTNTNDIGAVDKNKKILLRMRTSKIEGGSILMSFLTENKDML